ncbi:putative tyrosine-protein kinase pr2, partial [Operophtera brumata]
MQVFNRLRRISDRCKQKYFLIEDDEVYLSSSMNDLDGDVKHPSSPGDRSKFHFKFPQLHHNQPHDFDKDTLEPYAVLFSHIAHGGCERDVQTRHHSETGTTRARRVLASKNELPLPPRSSKPILVDKARHIRKYPLKLPTLPPPELNPPIIYQNAPMLVTFPTQTPRNSVDVCDGIEKVDTNPFTSNSANPFNCYMED